jgi:hypothetical protein
MNLQRTMLVPAAKLAALAVVVFALSLGGCSTHHQASAPVEPVPAGQVEVVGTLTAVKDDRPVDGGIDLTLETALGREELVRVPSSFIAGPRDAITAMHEVVDAAKIGDRLRARGTRDETGALRPETLERLP